MNLTADTSLIWPCPLPYPEVFSPGPSGPTAWLRKRVNLVVASLSWLALGSPTRAPSEHGKGRPLSSKQWKAVRSLERLIYDSTKTYKLDPALMGRAASKAEDHNKVLEALGRAVANFASSARSDKPVASEPCDLSAGAARSSDSRAECVRLPAPFGRVVGDLPVPPFCPAKSIQANRLRFPEAPSFDPRPYLDSYTAKRYDSPLDFATPPDPINPLPRVSIMASPEERVKLLRALAQSGRLKPVQPEPCRSGVSAGLFSVVKDMEREPLILDARPANSLEVPPCFWTGSLASASVLLPMLVGPRESLRVSTADLKDFFYFFKISEQRLQRNVLATRLRCHSCVWNKADGF